MSEKLLEVKELSYCYEKGNYALKHVNLEVNSGEKIAVMGSNGAGKSTFFLNINGVLEPEHGEIIYKNEKIQKKDLNKLRKNVGIVFQDADNQIIASTVLAEVAFGPMNLKLPKEEVLRRVDKALEYMNLTEFKNRPPHYLSGGEKKRVSIADIIAMDSEIIIFDEPTAALDPVNVKMLEKMLADLETMGKTLLISTHDVDFAYKWAERVVIFSEGSIIADGTPLEVLRKEEIIKKADLKKPVMLEIYEALTKSGKLSDDNWYPKSVEEFIDGLKCDKNISNILKKY